jgi:hypothetical protein
MLRRFGVVTVMDVKGYTTVLYEDDSDDTAEHPYSKGEWDAASTLGEDALFHLDTLKIANINQEGPTKTITGGQNADTLLKYGKTVTIEMQDALGKYDVLHHVYGVNYSANHQIAAFTDRFPSELTLVGTTFVIDQATGAKQPIHIIIPRFLGDGIFNLTQDAEGDATVFDLNGNILKFEGGVPSSDAEDTYDNRFDHEKPEDNHEWDGHIYGSGADNEFFFMCTKEVYDEIVAKGYRAAGEVTE